MDEKKTRYRKYTEEFKLEALELLKEQRKKCRADRAGFRHHARSASEMARSIPSHYPRREANSLGGKRFGSSEA